MNFWGKSKRYQSPDEAEEWLPEVKGKILRVGLFVNHSLEEVAEVWERGFIDVIQLHGDESLTDFQALRQRGAKLWRAAGVKDASSLEALAPSLPLADAWLLDAHAPGVFGGTGQAVDWNLAGAFVKAHSEVPIILAGGLTPENVNEAIQVVRPCAIDLASGVESAPAIKDVEKVAKLMNAVRG